MERQTKGREDSQGTPQAEAPNATRWPPALTSCLRAPFFPNTALEESIGTPQQVGAVSGSAICSNQLLLKSQEAQG